MQEVLTINGLYKHYGRVHAVNDLSLTVKQGEIYGFLGPNGSGKTTTLGILTGVVNPDSGNFRWFNGGNDADNRKKIGTILEQPLFYPYLSGNENLKIVADIKKVDYSEIAEVLEIVDLSARAKDKFKHYSLGMKQRLALASALLGNPEVLILDEPTNGLDPMGIAQIRNLILRIADRGITIILASHLLDEVQKVCTHVCVMDSGKKLFSGSVDALEQVKGSLILASDKIDLLREKLQEHKGINKIETLGNNRILASFSSEQNPAHINMWLYEQGITLSHLEKKSSNLEQQFIDLLSVNQQPQK